MYYPKSQIKTNLYTKGKEFTNSKTGSPYKGYYYKTSTGETYSGKTPNDLPSIKLSPTPPITPTPDSISGPQSPTSTIQDIEQNRKSFWASEFVGYNPKLDKTKVYNIPKSTYPKPTEQDYLLGEFKRYFLKKSNEPKFIEISQIDYFKFSSKDNSVPYELYIPIKIEWTLSGSKIQIYEINKRTIERTERQQQLYGFTQYFKGEFSKFSK